jgi:hypothetical protein
VTYLNSYANMDSEMITKIIGTVDPSASWENLVIPVDAPESIPLTMPDYAGHAAGGPFDAGIPFWAGEQGAELIFPSSAGHVLSHPDSMRYAASAGIKVPGYAAGTTRLPDVWSSQPPKVPVNIANNSGIPMDATPRITQVDQEMIIDLIVDAKARNVGNIRKRLRI